MKLRGTHVLMAYGPLLIVSFYETACAARCSLGYWPRASLDDPGQIEGVWIWITSSFLYILLLGGFPVAVVWAGVSVLRPLFRDSPEWRPRAIELGTGVVLLALSVAFLKWDPNGFVVWYFD